MDTDKEKRDRVPVVQPLGKEKTGATTDDEETTQTDTDDDLFLRLPFEHRF
jgi:hypothetical protein